MYMQIQNLGSAPLSLSLAAKEPGTGSNPQLSVLATKAIITSRKNNDRRKAESGGGRWWV